MLGVWSLEIGVFMAQDVHFAQLSEIPLLLNPGLTGVFEGYYRGILNYRNQWPAMGKPYSTFAASADAPFAMKRKGAYLAGGLNFYSDKAGDSKFGSTQANLSSSAILPVGNKSKFSIGLQFGMGLHSVLLSEIQWPNQYNGMQYDPGIASNEPVAKNSFSYFDAGVGVNYYMNNAIDNIKGKDITCFNVGAAFFHVNTPIQKFTPVSSESLYGRLVLNASMRYDFPKTKVGIVAFGHLHDQGPASEINFGMLVRYKINEGTKVTGFYTESAFLAGVHCRWGDAISPQVYFEFSDYAFGISYDFNISSYREVQKSTGALEISVRYANMKGAVRKNKV
jgi:type IX secretion system PorP/SprF family membrane protein